MHPRKYPDFRNTPKSLIEKHENEKLKNLSHPEEGRVGFDYMSSIPEAKKQRKREYSFWPSRKDYLFMLVFASLSWYDSMACVELLTKAGGYVIIVYILTCLTTNIVIYYLVIVFTIYSKKSLLFLGRMVPVLAGFAYIMFLLQIVRVLQTLRFLIYTVLFAYYAFSFNLLKCPSGNKFNDMVVNGNGVCVSLMNRTELEQANFDESCVLDHASLFIVCRNEERYMLSTFVLINVVFLDSQQRYLAMLLAILCYVVTLKFISKVENNFIKVAQGVTGLVIALNLSLLSVALFYDEARLGLLHAVHFGEWPDQELVFTIVAFSLPKITELYVAVGTTTCKLPLCTVPTFDSLLLTLCETLFVFTMSIPNVMMAGLISKTCNLKISTAGASYAPYTTIIFFMTYLPPDEHFWVSFYFFIHACFCFTRLILMINTLYLTFIWRHGHNKLILTLLHIYAFFALLYFYMMPDEEDHFGYSLTSIVINPLLLLVFSCFVIIYGVSRLQEDIAFMTSSPPADIMSFAIKMFPLFCAILLIWSVFTTRSLFQILCIILVLTVITSDIFIRLLISGSISQFKPLATHGPPNKILKAERHMFCLKSTVNRSTSNKNKFHYIFDKMKSEV